MSARLARVAVIVLRAAAAYLPAAPLAACSSPEAPPGDPHATEGSIGLAITLPGGATIETITYAIEGPATYRGTVDVRGAASTFAFVIPGVAPGDGYTIALHATSGDGGVACDGTSSAFGVRASQTTHVSVLLACNVTSEAGAVVVQGEGFDCASWRTAVAMPASAVVGGTVSLVGAAVAPDPAAITYLWTASDGSIGGASQSNATFTCPATPGPVTITLTVGDGPVPDGGTCPAASSTTTLTVACEPADAGAPDAGDAGPAFFRAAKVSTGQSHTCAITPEGDVACWGAPPLGNNTNTASYVPVTVLGLKSAVAVAAGDRHTCAITGAGGVVCWGDNQRGQVGPGTTDTSVLVPTPVPGLSSGIVAIAAGDDFTCAITDAGALLCWGDDSLGQLGNGATSATPLPPTPVIGMESGVMNVVGGMTGACAMTTSELLLRCWGTNRGGVFGEGGTSYVPAELLGEPGYYITGFAVGEYHACTLDVGGRVYCWGMLEQPMANPITGLPPDVVAIAATARDACALTSGGAVLCWQAFDPPTVVPGLESGVTALTEANHHTCALLSSGAVACWGENESGQLGDGTTNAATTPVLVAPNACVPSAEQCANGIDDDCNGLADCQDPACAAWVALGPVPAGWAGPLAVANGSTAGPPPSCAAPYGTASLTAYDGLVAPSDACASSCRCDPPSGASCSASVDFAAAYFPAPDPAACLPGNRCTAVAQPALDQCYRVSITQCGVPPYPQVPSARGDWYVSAHDGVTSGGACAPVTSPPAQPAPATWSTRFEVCAYDGASTAVGTQTCAPPARPGARVCISHVESQDCPPGPWTDKSLIWTSTYDQRVCSCSCGAPPSVPCTVQGALYDTGDCTGPSLTVAENQCARVNDATASVRFTSVGAAWCAASGTTQGNVYASAPWTICCVP